MSHERLVIPTLSEDFDESQVPKASSSRYRGPVITATGGTVSAPRVMKPNVKLDDMFIPSSAFAELAMFT